MLKSLYIKNFIIIDEVEIDFNNGFSVFTGETGAGKSIIIDAISYAIGQRLDQNLIKKGKEQLSIQLVYDINNNQTIINKLKNFDIDYEDELIVDRKINNQGKSITKINHQSVTLSVLKELFSSTIDIHNQHETQYLLNKNNHINLLDKFINQEELVNTVSSNYMELKKLEKEYQEILNNTSNDNYLEFIQNELKEIEDIDPIIDEDNKLNELDKEIKNSSKLINNINDALYRFNKQNGINEELYSILKTIDESSNFYKQINDSYYNLVDVFDEMNNYRNSLDFSEKRINEIQERIYLLNKLKRKFGPSIQNVLDKKVDLQKQIA